MIFSRYLYQLPIGGDYPVYPVRVYRRGSSEPIESVAPADGQPVLRLEVPSHVPLSSPFKSKYPKAPGLPEGIPLHVTDDDITGIEVDSPLPS